MMNNQKLNALSLHISDWFCDEYPSLLKNGVKAYRGWTKDILDLNHEEDIFKLLLLAINWNTPICWDTINSAIQLQHELDDR